MPRYDYRCQRGHQYELQQPFGSPTEHPCEKCGRPAKRIVTVAPPIVFKAGGYYKTAGRDFDGDSGASSTSSSSSAKSSGGKSSGGKSSGKSSSSASSGSSGDAKPASSAAAD